MVQEETLLEFQLHPFHSFSSLCPKVQGIMGKSTFTHFFCFGFMQAGYEKRHISTFLRE